ncbi:MAG: hypothetical protein WCD76_14020 [Pyrinomonadaceae bacterium]
MRKLLMRGLAMLALNVVFVTAAPAQAGDKPVGSTTDDNSKQVLAELRRTREVIEQLRRELIQLQVATIRMRLQQDVVANKEARLDSIRSEIQAQDEVLVQFRERVKKLEALDATQQAEDERERARTERQEAKGEMEREENKLERLRNQEAQLMAELHTERARLKDLLLGIESMGSEATAGVSDTPVSARDLTGQPNN